MFLSKYAKLVQRIENNNKDIKIFVYDDEIETDSPVAWIYGTVDMGSKSINLNTLDFTHELFDYMEKSKEDSVIKLLFRTFLNEYDDKYGKSGPNGWFNVGIGFDNFVFNEQYEKAQRENHFPTEGQQEQTQAPNENEENKQPEEQTQPEQAPQQENQPMAEPALTEAPAEAPVEAPTQETAPANEPTSEPTQVTSRLLRRRKK